MGLKINHTIESSPGLLISGNTVTCYPGTTPEDRLCKQQKQQGLKKVPLKNRGGMTSVGKPEGFK